MFCLRQEDEPSDDAKLQDTSISASLTTEELAAALQTTMRKVKVGDEFVNAEKADASFKLIEEVWGEMRSDRLDHRKHVKTSFVAPAAGDVKDLLKEARASQKRETVTGGMLCHEGNESDGRAVLECDKSIMPIVEDWHTNKCKIANEKQCLFLDAVKCRFQEECNDKENQTVGKSEPLRALICGGPGVGKSYGILSMKSLFKALGWRQSMQFQFAAFQAVVADQVGGDTLHHSCGVSFSCGNRSTHERMTKAKTLSMMRWLIIDEISQVGAELLSQCETNMRFAMQNAGTYKLDVNNEVRPWGGLNVLYVGAM